jgi:hypothetical protein
VFARSCPSSKAVWIEEDLFAAAAAAAAAAATAAAAANAAAAPTAAASSSAVDSATSVPFLEQPYVRQNSSSNPSAPARVAKCTKSRFMPRVAVVLMPGVACKSEQSKPQC